MNNTPSLSLPTVNTMTTRCGFAAVLGVPNVGKSTLVNSLVGSKVSIVSHKVQTTRRRILGIAMHDQSQIVLVDTPGIFSPIKTLERAMVKAAWDSVPDCDTILVMVDASAPSQTATQLILSKLAHVTVPIVLVVNKVDRVDRSQLLPLVQQYGELFPAIRKFFMVSAKTQSGLTDLKTYLAKSMPIADWMFPEDQTTDIPLRLWAAEITREKIYTFLHQELPYTTYVETEKWENFRNGDIKIMQTIHVERDTQKSIVLGKGGSMLKQLGLLSRQELEQELGTRVHLILNVRVTADWSNDPFFYAIQGLERPVK